MFHLPSSFALSLSFFPIMASAKKRLEEHMQSVAVPTSSAAVVALLRELSQPVRLFGESEPARRERLRAHLVLRPDAAALAASSNTNTANNSSSQHLPEDRPTEQVISIKKQRKMCSSHYSFLYFFFFGNKFFYPGPSSLSRVRSALVVSSLDSASSRLRAARAERRTAASSSTLARLSPVASEVAAARPLASCAFDGPGNRLAVADWTGTVKVWGTPKNNLCGEKNDLIGIMVSQKKKVLDSTSLQPVWTRANAHEDRAQHAVWLDERRILSCGADCIVRLWDTQQSQQQQQQPQDAVLALKGHTQRVSRVAVAGGGRLALSTSHDGTWRCWDLEHGGENVGVQVNFQKQKKAFVVVV